MRPALVPMPVGAGEGAENSGGPVLRDGGPVTGPTVALVAEDTDRVDGRCGLLPVVPRLASYDELRRVIDLAASTGWPVIGVLADSEPPTHAGPRWPWRSR